MGSSSRYKNSNGKKRKYFRGKVTKSKDNAATNVTDKVVAKQINFSTKIECFVEINR